MNNFLYLEGAYLILGGFALLITLFVSTRPFMAKGAVKKGLLWVSLVVAVMVGTHYMLTSNRMTDVAIAFEKDLPIICEIKFFILGVIYFESEKLLNCSLSSIGSLR
jgi:hypothetical protein